MKVAIPVWNNRIAPVFDTAGQWLSVSITDNQWRIEKENVFSGTTPEQKVRELLDQQVQFLICGAIPFRYERFFIEAGCGVKSFVAGEPQQLLEAWLNSSLDEPRYCMPGCRGQGRRNRGRGRGWSRA